MEPGKDDNNSNSAQEEAALEAHLQLLSDMKAVDTSFALNWATMLGGKRSADAMAA
ncbi:hypothetical protein SPRG_15860, partial [Saprolegnia parasitica CBS 223.65]